MSRYIDAEALKEKFINSNANGINLAIDRYALKCIEDAPSIDLDDYVPKEFHNKTCEAMAKRHQEEIADMVRVVRCKECKRWWGNHFHDNEDGKCPMDAWIDGDGFCSYGEREGE